MAFRALSAPLLLLIASGCASAANKSSVRTDDSTPEKSAIVIKGSDLGGNLLDGMRYRVPSMQLSQPPGECPRIVFRGIRSIRNQANPTVYLDGTRMIDTCILQQVSANDINFIEVYPSGSTARPSYDRNPFGLILIFRHR